MKVEPLYGLPVEEPGDVEGWSVNVDQPGTLLADAVAAELDRIESDINAFQSTLDALPGNMKAGNVAMVAASFRTVTSTFYNSNFQRASESVVFKGAPFEQPPAVVLIWNAGNQPGVIIEVCAANVTTSGFTAVMATAQKPVTQFTSRWIAMERTQ